MIENIPRFPGAVLVTLVIALLLTLIPLPEQYEMWRPEWFVLTFVHWALVIREKSSLILAFLMGLLVDVQYGSLLGQHALGFVIVTYAATRLGLRMTAEAVLQQFALISVVLAMYLLLNLWIEGVTGYTLGGWLYWGGLLSSLLIWPFYHMLLSLFYIQRKVV